MKSVVCNQMQFSISLFRFPIFIIFEPFTITALLLGRGAVVLALIVWNMGMGQLRYKFLDTWVSKIHWFWKGYWAINIVRPVLLWILYDYMPAIIPYCIQQSFCIVFITSRTQKITSRTHSSVRDILVCNVSILYLLSEYKHNLV